MDQRIRDPHKLNPRRTIKMNFKENENGYPIERVEFHTNIKGLPEGEYFTGKGYSDRKAWKVVKSTAKTKKLVEIEVNQDPDFKPEFHCSNQREQTWVFNKFCTREIVIRLGKKGWSFNGSRFLGKSAVNFYDYNF